MAGAALSAVNCVDANETDTCQTGAGAETSTPVQPDLPERGSSCVEIRDQDDKAMKNCRPIFEIDEDVLKEDAANFEKWGKGETPENPCNGTNGEGGAGGSADGGAGEGGTTEGAKERFFVYGTPGTYKILAECDQPANELLDKPINKLVGHINVDIKEGIHGEEYSSRLINSFCTDGYEFVTDPQNITVTFNDHLGFSENTWCPNTLSEQELIKITVADQILDCSDKENCDPTDGRYLLMAHGPHEEGQLAHLTFTAQTGSVPEGKEYTVWVKLKNNNDPNQQYNVPVKIRGPVCGNGIIEHKEECEGDYPNGQTCEDHGFSSGEVECIDCKISLDNCVTEPPPEE